MLVSTTHFFFFTLHHISYFLSRLGHMGLCSFLDMDIIFLLFWLVHRQVLATCLLALLSRIWGVLTKWVFACNTSHLLFIQKLYHKFDKQHNFFLETDARIVCAFSSFILLTPLETHERKYVRFVYLILFCLYASRLVYSFFIIPPVEMHVCTKVRTFHLFYSILLYTCFVHLFFIVFR